MIHNRHGIFGGQPKDPKEQPLYLGGAAAGLGIGAAAGFLPYKEGRLWDKYIGATRAVETAFPGAILRTFRASETLSPLESYNKIEIGKDLLGTRNKYSEFLGNALGQTPKELTLQKKGLVFGELLGDGGKSIGQGLQVAAGSKKGEAIADYYARLYGVDLKLHGVAGSHSTDSISDTFLRAEYKRLNPSMKYKEWLDSLSPAQKQKRIILGAKYRESVNFFGKELKLSRKMQTVVARAEVGINYGRAQAATTVGRLNTLLRAPVEIPVIGKHIQKIPFVRSLATSPGSATKMLKGYVGKGIALAGAWKGLEYLDYLRAEGNQVEATLSGIIGGGAIGAFIGKMPGQRFSPKGAIIGAALGAAMSVAPRFDEGIFAGAATTYADAQIARAKVSESTGVSDSLRRHHEIAPDFNTLGTALGFGGVGALSVGVLDYMSFLGEGGASAWKSKDPVWSVLEESRELRKAKVAEFVWNSKLGQKVTATKAGKVLGKIKHPMAFGLVGGLALWAGLNAGIGLIGGNPLAAIPGAGILGTEESPEELEAIYSGEQDIAVRKGRWWEAGRSSAYEGGGIDYFRPHAIARLRSRAYQKGLYGSEEERWEHDPLINPLKAVFGSDEWKYHYEQKYQHERPAPLTSTYGEDVPFVGPLIAATVGKLIKPRKMIRPEEWNLSEAGGVINEPTPRPETEPAYEFGGLSPGAPVAPEEGSQIINRLNYLRREAVGLVGFAEGSLEKKITGREEVFQNKKTFETMSKETGSEYWLWKHMNVGGAALMSEPVRRFVPRTPSYLETYNPLTNTQPSWLPDNYFIDLKHGNPLSKIPEGEIRLPGPGYAALNPEVAGVDPENYPLMHRLKILSDVAMWSPEYKSTLNQAKGAHLSEQQSNMLATIEDQVDQKKERRKLTPYRFDEDSLQSQTVTVSEVLQPGIIKTKELGDMTVDLQGIGNYQNDDAKAFSSNLLTGRQIQLMTPAMSGRAYTPNGRLKAVGMIEGQDIGSIYAEEGVVNAAPLEDEFEQLRYSGRERLAGKIAETATHGAEVGALEMLTPISPASKMIRQRSAIEEYAATRAIGTDSAFWDKPFENFMRPAAASAGYGLGLTDIPSNVQKQRDITEYFDMLKWAKEERLRRLAVAEGNTGAARSAQFSKAKTTFGADVFGEAPIRSLPRQDRDFFDEFVNARSEKDRQQILNLIPENQQRVYMAQWMQQEEAGAQARVAAKQERAGDDRILTATKSLRKAEGFSYTNDLEEQWMKETNGEIPYDEWIRLKKSEEYFSTHSLPGADWLGWSASVDLEDVKMKYVETQGLDYHSFDLWGAREQSMARKPYINNQLIQEMGEGDALQNVLSLDKILGAEQSYAQTSRIYGNMEDSYRFEISDGRENMIEEAYKRMGA